MAGPRFVADADAARVETALDGLTALYHRPSGSTHVVAAPVPELLAAIAEAPGDAGEIVARLAAAHDLAGEDALEEVIAARLEELEAAGLVRRA